MVWQPTARCGPQRMMPTCGTYHPCLIVLAIFASVFSGYTVLGIAQTALEEGYMVLIFFAGTCVQCIGKCGSFLVCAGMVWCVGT